MKCKDLLTRLSIMIFQSVGKEYWAQAPRRSLCPAVDYTYILVTLVLSNRYGERIKVRLCVLKDHDVFRFFLNVYIGGGGGGIW